MIIGAAFAKIVNSLVNDVLMPPIGRLTGKVDFSGLFISLDGNHYATLAEAKTPPLIKAIKCPQYTAQLKLGASA